MENPRNDNISGGGEDEENKQFLNDSSVNNSEQNFQSLYRSSSSIIRSREQSFLGINPQAGETDLMSEEQSAINISRFFQNSGPTIIDLSLLGFNQTTAAQTEPMREQQSASNISRFDLNLLEFNQTTAAQTEPISQEHSGRPPSSAGSHHSKGNNREDTAANTLNRKKASDRAYRERVKELLQEREFNLKTLKAESESLNEKNESLLKDFEELNKKYEKQHETLQQMESNLKKFEEKYNQVNEKCESQSRELEKLKKKNKKQQQNEQEMKLRLEALEIENGKLKEKNTKKRESNRQLKSNVETLKAEKERLMEQVFETLKEITASVNRKPDTQSKELCQLSKLENLEKALTKTCGPSRQSLAGGFGPNVEAEGFLQSCQTITRLPSSSAFPIGPSYQATGSPSPNSICSFEATNNSRFFQNPAPGEQNLVEFNQATTAQTEPMREQQSCQRPSSADSQHSKLNIAEDIAADSRAKKRAYDRAYRQRVKDQTQFKLETLQNEKETLSKELDELKKKYEKQHLQGPRGKKQKLKGLN